MSESLSKDELVSKLGQITSRYDAFKQKGLKLDMTRGKPSGEQLDLANGLMTTLSPSDYKSGDGVDARNYGGLDGIPEMKAIFAELFETSPGAGDRGRQLEPHDDARRRRARAPARCPRRRGRVDQGEGQVPLSGSGLRPSLRHLPAFRHRDGERRAQRRGSRYGRRREARRHRCVDQGHVVRAEVREPHGLHLLDEVVRRLASMKTAAPDFRLFWDNAYALHDLFSEGDKLLDVIGASAKAGNPNRPIVFASTSKISYAGAGVAAMASSPTTSPT